MPKKFTMKQRSWLKSESPASILTWDLSPSAPSVCLVGLCFFLRMVCTLKGWGLTLLCWVPYKTHIGVRFKLKAFSGCFGHLETTRTQAVHAGEPITDFLRRERGS